MATILRKLWVGYQVLFDELADPRTKGWPLVAKPYQGLTLLGLYLMFSLKWGPKLMKDRKPFNLDKLLIVYNAFQVVCCVYIFVTAIIYAWGWNYKWICEPVATDEGEISMTVAKTVYMYYLLKILDLLDTVFFVLRKKFNQVSFLHVYHHTGMVMLVWGAATYFPGGHGTLIGVINSFVHIIMYSYYLLTVAVPSVKDSIWWKKYITQLQIIQFIWLVFHMATVVFVTDCEYPRWTAAVFLPQNIFMLILFVDFYIKAYIRKKPSQDNKSEEKLNKSESEGRINDEFEKGTPGKASNDKSNDNDDNEKEQESLQNSRPNSGRNYSNKRKEHVN